MLHNVMLCYRSATAPLPTGAATLAGTYPADIAPTESLFYDAGASTRFRLPCVRSKAQVGKMWWSSFGGAALSVDGATFASRTLGGGQGLLQVLGADGTALHCADAAADRKQHADFPCAHWQRRAESGAYNPSADQGKRSASRDDQDSSGLHRGNGGAQRSFSAVASGSTDATLGGDA